MQESWSNPLNYKVPDDFGPLLLDHAPGRGTRIRGLLLGLVAFPLGGVGMFFFVKHLLDGEQMPGGASFFELAFGGGLLAIMIIVGLFELVRFWKSRGYRVQQYQYGLVIHRQGEVQVVSLRDIAHVHESVYIPKAHLAGGSGPIGVSAAVPLKSRFTFRIQCRDGRRIEIDASQFKLGQSIGGALRNQAETFGYQFVSKRNK